MQEEKTSVLGNGLVWFGAAVSIAEIMTGTLFAPLGVLKGLLAIIIGHLIGCAMLYYAGLIGARTMRSAMETVKLTFGSWGGKAFALLNVIQLIGWTAVMIEAGGSSAYSLFQFGASSWLWCCAIGMLIIAWLIAGVGLLQKINLIAISLLFALSLVLSYHVFYGIDTAAELTGSMTFGAALELSIAMPVSWLPLIADYTCNAQKPKLSCGISALVYFLGSCWMHAIGMLAALHYNEPDVASIMRQAGSSIAIIIVLLSTVTTTFLDVNSAAVSCQSIWARFPQKCTGCIACIIGTALAIFCNTSRFESFLYLIGSIFVPMATIQIIDMLFAPKQPAAKKFALYNLLLWTSGFILYRIFLHLDLSCGSTIPVILIIAILQLTLHFIHRNH